MSFYGGNQNGGQPGSNPQQQMGRQPTNPGLQNVQQVLTPQLFNINVNPNQLHNFFNEHGTSQNSLQLTAAAAAANQSIILQSQQQQSFPVNLINEQLGVGVGQLISSATVSQGQMQGLPISMSSALNFPQALQVHTQTAQSQQSQAQNQSKQRVFTGTVTKVHDNFGFIDEEVFFQMGVVKGPILPKEGDRVLVEADFNSNMPFKWNATRVQIVNIGGGMNSSLNNLPSMNASQQQHMGFNASVGMQKPTSAAPPPVLTSQPTNARPHGPQPVTIVSNPHSVYSSASNPRGRTAVVGAPVPPPGSPMVASQRDAKRPMGHMPMAPDPPGFHNNAPMGTHMSSDRDLDRDSRGRDRDRSRERGRDRTPERTREHVRERSRDRARGRSRERERSRDRGRNDRSKERVQRNRSRSRERVVRDRSRDRSRERNVRGSSRERTIRERSAERSLSLRGRSRSRDRNTRDVSADKRDKVKRERERSPERRDRVSTREKEKKKSPSPAGRSRKDDSKKEDKSKDKERAPVEKSKSGRDKSPSALPQASERGRRSRSRESVRTDRGHAHATADRSRSRSTSPRRKAVRSVARYAVEIPKFPLDTKELSAKELQRRYPNLYIPSDFFLAKSVWMDTFPVHQPFDIGHPCPVQIMRKGVQKIEIPNVDELEEAFNNIPDVLEPADASYIFKAKVMIPSLNSLETIYRKACSVSDNPSDIPDSPQKVDKLINFIVGMKTSKHEIMALGGPWSPSLDGPNPQSDPQTLINTAIRSIRALTGLNLSRCKKWYRFMELYYKRTNCLETVVFYLPDVWSCLPGTKDWSKLKSVYKFALHGEKVDVADTNVNNVKADKEANPPASGSKSTDETTTGKGQSGGDVAKSTSGTESSVEKMESGDKAEADTDSQEDDVLNNSGLLVIDEAPASPTREDGSAEDGKSKTALEGTAIGTVDGTNAPDGAAETEEKGQVEGSSGVKMNTNEESTPEEKVVEKMDVDKTNGDCEHALEPTHFSALTPKNMTVVQLKDELNRRNLSAKGLKSQLTTRLIKALKDEEALEKMAEQATEETKTEEAVEAASDMDVTVQNTEEANDTEVKEEEHDIRIVNSSLIFETQDDEMSIEDGELKEEHSAESGSVNAEYKSIISKFPADTFPIIKPGMKDEDVKSWERRYALPKNPRLLVYPSTSNKSGNFDCLSMTLGLLRDYRIIDKKEDNFEVSLFSEFFHEMLQRDFAFKIYCEIVAEAQKPSIDDNLSEKDGDSKGEKTEKDSGEPASKKRKLSTTPGNSVVQPTKKTTDPFLLLSFIFFDITRCGYITEIDLEDLIGSIGLGLTRSQIRKAVQKVAHKGSLYYRKWTDRPEKPKGLSEDEIKALSLGNKAYFPVFVLQESSAVATSSKSETIGDSDETSEAVIAVVDEKEIDVRKLMAQVETLEKDLTVAESSLNVMKNSLNESKSQVTDLKKSLESLKDELAKNKDALKKSETSEKSTRENLEVFKRSTERFMERVKDLVKLPSTASNKEKTETSSKNKDKTISDTKERTKSNESNHLECSQNETHANDASSTTGEAPEKTNA